MHETSLRYAGGHYLDRTAALESGEVTVAGVDFEYQRTPLREVFRRMSRDAAFEASEMSLGTLMTLHDSGDRRLVGLPIFPSRSFRHGTLFVTERSGIQRPEDLDGARIGLMEYQMTAAIWVRAFLQHDYGVRAADIAWFTGGQSDPDYVSRGDFDFGPSVKVSAIGSGHTLDDMLASGELDGSIGGRPRAELFEQGVVRELFPDVRAAEQAYFARTGFFPIMHVAVMRADVYERDPAVAVAVCDAFQEAKVRAVRRLFDVGTLAIVHPWLGQELEQLAELFGGDPWVYGYGANRALLDAMTTYAWEQGVTSARLSSESLFAPVTLDWDPGLDPFVER